MRFTPDIHQRFMEQARWTEQAQRLLFETGTITSKSNILEVGCGTGALLSSLYEICPANYTGVDLQFDLLKTVDHLDKTFSFTCSDANNLPFRNDSFDSTVCHYLLLWMSNPETVLFEMQRVTRSGGIIAILAEPDYSSRIDFPDELAMIGSIQRDSLIRQGANPDIGRYVADLLVRVDCTNISWGILGAFQKQPSSMEEFLPELNVLRSDLIDLLNQDTIARTIKQEIDYRLSNHRIQFIPTFFAFGVKK